MPTTLSSDDIHTAIETITTAILRRHPKGQHLVLMGIIDNGVHLAARIQQMIRTQLKIRIPVGKLDITLYRKDIDTEHPYLHIQESHIPCKLKDKTIILVQDFLDIGHDVNAALNALSDFEAPHSIELAVLLHTKKTRYPFIPTYEGLQLQTDEIKTPQLLLFEKDGEDLVTFG